MGERKGNFTFSVLSDYYLSHRDFNGIFQILCLTGSEYFLAPKENPNGLYIFICHVSVACTNIK